MNENSALESARRRHTWQMWQSNTRDDATVDE
jgi:hypothetical protein